FAARAHPACDGEAARLRLLAAVLRLECDGPLAADRRDVERERLWRTDVRLAEAAEQDAKHRVRVRSRTHRRPHVGAHRVLIDDDGGRQTFQDVDVGPSEARHEPLQEVAVRLVDHALRLGSDGVEDQRALTGPGHAREHGQAPLGYLDGDVLEVVLARTMDTDQVVAVGWMRTHRRPRCDTQTWGSLFRSIGAIVVEAVWRRFSEPDQRTVLQGQKFSPIA